MLAVVDELTTWIIAGTEPLSLSLSYSTAQHQWARTAQQAMPQLSSLSSNSGRIDPSRISCAKRTASAACGVAERPSKTADGGEIA